MLHSRLPDRHRSIAAAVFCALTLAGALVGVAARPAEALVTAVSGDAYGYYVNVGLFGGPRSKQGHGQVACTGTNVPVGCTTTGTASESPSVTLPSGGSSTAVVAEDAGGAKAQYGPAVIFGGRWLDVAGAPPSGPISVQTQGTSLGGSVTSSAGIVLDSLPAHETPDDGPGGIGPGPLIADEAHSTCTASESGVSGSATFVNGVLELKYDTVSQEPIVTLPIPTNPPPNYTVHGTIDHVGDHFTIVLNEQVIGPDSITVNAAHMYLLGEVARGDMVVASSTCSLTSTTPNAAPVAGDDAFSATEDTPLTVSAPGLLANDTDANGNPLTATNAQAVFVPGPSEPSFSEGTTYTFPSDPPNGSATLNADGSFTYTPDPDFSGTDTFTYVVRDPRGANDPGLVTITVAAVPDAPVAGDDTYRATEDTPLTVAAPGVLANDTDGDGNALSAGSASDPPNGSVTLSADGSLTYTPDLNFVGTDTFTYVVDDGTGRSDTALVTINVVVDQAVMLKDLNPGAANSSPTRFTPFAGSVYFLSAPFPAGPTTGLWKTDGTAAGTVQVKAFSAAGSAAMTVIGGTMYFQASESATGSELWKTDGTTAGTVLVKDINPGTASSSPTNFRDVAGTLFFSAGNGTGAGAHGTELWKTDGTTAGTVMVKDINAGTNSSSPADLTAVGATLYFAATTAAEGAELWKSDGTTAGTVMVRDINAGTAGSSLSQLRVIGSTVYLRASNGTTAGLNGIELWRSDGTAAGTVMVKDINPGTGSSSPNGLVVHNNTLLFSATDGGTTYGSELWRSDGTAAGTELVADITLGPGNSSPGSLAVAGGMVYFSAAGPQGAEPWKTDGTSAGTVLVADVNPGAGSSSPSNFTTVGSLVFFTANNGTHGIELWTTDGTVAGTALAKDITPGSASSSPANLTPALGTMLFSANEPATGVEPWRLTPPKRAPVAVDDTYTTTAGTPLNVATPGVLANDTDGNGDVLTAGSATDPPHGSVTLNADGSFAYAPDPGFAGTDTFTYVADDGDGGTDPATVTISVTDPTPLTFAVSDVWLREGSSGTTAATFTVSRTGSTAGTASVKYKTSGGTATAGSDYTALALTTLNFAVGESTKTVSVNVNGDGLPEANETFNLALSASTGATVADAAGTATITNDDGVAYLAVADVVVTEGNSGTTPATFTVTRSGNTTGTSTVKFKTNGGTATAGTDYTALALTTVTFAPGETTKTVTVDAAGDTTDEANETVLLALSAPSAGTLLSDAAGTATIVDDDGPLTPGPVTFVSIADLWMIEGDAGTTAATFTLTRSGNTTGMSTLKYRTSGGTATAGTDYTALALTNVSFAPGETTKTVSVNVNGDALAEADETFNLALSAPSAGTVLSDNSGIATVANDDGAAYVAVGNISVTEGNSGTTAATFTLTRSGNTSGSSTVKYQTQTGTAGTADFTAVPLTTFTFASGETTKTVTVNVTGDVTVEPNETFNLALSAPVGATISDTSGTATIVNDD